MTTTKNSSPLDEHEAASDLPDIDATAALILQSQTSFAQNVLLHPNEDCWSQEPSNPNQVLKCDESIHQLNRHFL